MPVRRGRFYGAYHRHPRLPLDPAFRDAVYADTRGITHLAPLVDWDQTKLSRLLNKRLVVATPLTRDRFTQLAAIIGYTGEVFCG